MEHTIDGMDGIRWHGSWHMTKHYMHVATWHGCNTHGMHGTDGICLRAPQKECIVNAGLAAHDLNLTLVLPHVDLIGRGNEQFEPRDTKYVGPYTIRSRWGRFGHLFDKAYALSALRKARVKARVQEGIHTSVISLPAVEEISDCGNSHRPRLQGTCDPTSGDPSLMRGLFVSWRKLILERCAREQQLREGGGAQGISSSRLIFDAGMSLCWNAYKSRNAAVCTRQFSACAPVLAALRWNSLIAQLQSSVLSGIARLVSNDTAHSATPHQSTYKAPAWVAVHVRAFVCAQNKRKLSVSHVQSALRRRGFTRGILYVVSSIPAALLQQALPSFQVVSKETFLSGVRRFYPFEVCAALDYGVAVEAPMYLGEPDASSFDAFADEERNRSNRSAIQRVLGLCAKR